jgi:molybdopterin molybdotransferase
MEHDRHTDAGPTTAPSEGETQVSGEGASSHAHGGSDMRSVDEVRTEILHRVRTLSPIQLHLQEAFGCVLASDVVADTDIPPFSSSAMDGFAVRAADVDRATNDQSVSLRIAGWAPAGRHPEATVGAGEAVQIATGAPIPAGADSIVPIEQAVIEGERVHILKGFGEGAFVRPAGQDVRSGAVLVPKGRRLAAPELGLIASSGHSAAIVYPRPRVVVLSTGDELVDPGRPAPYGMIRDANSYTLFGALREAGAVPYLGGIVRDEAEALKETVLGLITRADALISSGGVSVG